MGEAFELAPTPMQNPYTDPSLMESDADKSFSQSTIMQTSQKLSGQNDAAIAQRERAINDIAQGIIELSDIFRELQSMVIDQGTMLDRIDYNVERMGTDVQQAGSELKTATSYQRRTIKRKLLILLILLVLGFFIVLIVKPKRSSSHDARSVRRTSDHSLLLSRAPPDTFSRDVWLDPDISIYR